MVRMCVDCGLLLNLETCGCYWCVRAVRARARGSACLHVLLLPAVLWHT